MGRYFYCIIIATPIYDYFSFLCCRLYFSSARLRWMAFHNIVMLLLWAPSVHDIKSRLFAEQRAACNSVDVVEYMCPQNVLNAFAIVHF